MNKFFEMSISVIMAEEPFAVVCHGDSWTNNFLFKYDHEGTIKDVSILYSFGFLFYLLLLQEHNAFYPEGQINE